MKIALIGLGSIGSVLAFYLLKDTNVELFVVSERKMDHIVLKDLNKEIYTSRKFIKIKMSELLMITDIDVIIISGKITENNKIIDELNKLTTNIPPILLVQNGINNEFDFTDKYTVYRIVLSISSYISDNNTTIFNFFKSPLIYGSVFEKKNEKIVKVMDILSKEGLKSELTDKTKLLNIIWMKCAVNCCVNALSALYLMKMNSLMSHLYIKSLIEEILNEIKNVASEYSITLDVAQIKEMLKTAPENYSSLYKDIVQDKNTEIDYLNGMIVKLGNEKSINVVKNAEITNLIKSLIKKNPDNNKICNEEFEIIKQMFDTQIISILKNYLNQIINKLFEIGFSKESFLSDDKNEMGNIGNDNPDYKFEYLLNADTTIREKVSSIINTFFDSVNKRPKGDSISLINYLFTNKTHLNRIRINQLKVITNKKTDETLYNYIYKNKFFDLWAPIIYIYPEFVFKRQITKNIKKPAKCSYDENELLEPLSENEKSFYNNIEFHTGKCYYEEHIDLLKTDLCSIAGLSGHTLLLLELAKLLNFNWKPMLLCCIFTNVPLHHSVDEVVRCVNVMKLKKENIKDNIIFLKNIIKELNNKTIAGKKTKTQRSKNNSKLTRRRNNFLEK